MAKISESFLEFKGTPSLIRIPVLCTENQWYITTAKNSVTKIKDSKSVHTWTLSQGNMHYFKTPVAFFNGKLYSIIDENILLKWFDEDEDLENAEKVKIQEEVHSVIHLKGSEPLVVLESGKFLLVNDSVFHHLKPYKSIKLKNCDCLEWVDAVVSDADIEVFYLTFNKKNKQKSLYCFSVNKEDETLSSPSIFHISRENASFKVCCLNHGDLTFFSLWSDGTLQGYNVKDSSNKMVLSVEDVTDNTIVDICCINSKHILIAKGQPKSKECLLEIWDTEHTVLKSNRKVEVSELLSLQISIATDYLFLNFICDKLIVIPYFLDSSFASTLNTSKPKELKQLAWNTDLEVKQIVEDEPMDVTLFNSSTLDPIQELAETLLNEDSNDLKFISESELIKILLLVIRYKKNNKDLNKKMYILLNITFSAFFNDVLLMKHLKSLNLEDTLFILDILSKYLKNSLSMTLDAQKPSDIQIVNWICLIISSHTEMLLFTKDKGAQKLLKNLKRTLSEKIQEFDDLEGLQSYLSICCSKKDILPQQYSLEKYCLETLDI